MSSASTTRCSPIFADVLAHAADSGADCVITVDAANIITLKGVHEAELASANFIFT